mmetsp:Transcript_60215/g.176728  ORF Transcript_60215/g.176728 Transcript_60215/m.176728 type:complete len:279 (-) Transcript_60215:442-1278(-)
MEPGLGAPCAFYGVAGEADLVAEIIGKLSRGPVEVNNLSSKYAAQFNDVVRGAEDTPFNPEKRNDGSFKKWIVKCGFEVGPVFERNRSFVSLPAATGCREACPSAPVRHPRGQRGHHRGPRGAARGASGVLRWEAKSSRCSQDVAEDAIGLCAAEGPPEETTDLARLAMAAAEALALRGSFDPAPAAASGFDQALAHQVATLPEEDPAPDAGAAQSEDGSHEVGVEEGNDSEEDEVGEFLVVDEDDAWTDVQAAKPAAEDVASEGLDSDVEIVDVLNL